MSDAKARPTREERLAAKLRENLRRRKSQARALGQDGGAQADGAPAAASPDSPEPLSKEPPSR